ncbi:hypothetical protein [Rhodopseudomonas palustris]|uniref:Uncharacterized protein n=1 Tax=Rhodopseudomonas palustris (strain ATCC BAA-98 / CGA009) TaxID=258594 RepID=A0AAE9XYF1_RHOPA|nr:hypothetical protein [Rhodopseudomonas palustris]OPF91405.1 hypothetical protein B1S06_18175 [Rhodopseudomonas palustris]RJF60437.1 hypothetical protein D4Q71_23225 [Rhodopseudomonas palustris]WAB79015.1 hypothetical protein OR798_06900 [Rhodopseudomonas palustris]WCL91477.1 hypothetical protein TX73_006895 [Rhodopseudomonas palustris CGA009]WND52913.1 hypothetical protein L1A21_06870 [Rhodopseudomonas palustris]
MADEFCSPELKQDQYLSAVRRELDLFERRERDFRAQLRQQRRDLLAAVMKIRSNDRAVTP